MSFNSIIVEAPADGVGLIQFNRPKQYNALNNQLLTELGEALATFDANDDIAVIVITGSEKAFAAGADIAEMANKTGVEMSAVFENASGWTAISECKKPTIAAVSGYAYGGGFELALQCDMIIASNSAKFALPEITLGLIPAAGGTQRLAKLIGKSLAMEMILTARPMSANEALERGVISRVVDIKKLMPDSIKLAETITSKTAQASQVAKACVNKALNTTLDEGLAYEQTAFVPLFDSPEAKQLMNNFLNKK